MCTLALNTMLPDGDRFKLPVLVIVRPVPLMLLALTLAAVVILPVAKINPPVLILAPVMFPPADTNPPVRILEPVMLPLAEISPVIFAPEFQNSALRLPDKVLPVKNLIVLPADCVAMPKLPPFMYKYPSLAPNAV